MAKMNISDFYCTKCGHKGIPIVRSKRAREAVHLKKLYCLTCKQETNHVECRGFGQYNYQDFLIEFENGNFDEEGMRRQPWRQFEAEMRKRG